MQNSDGIQSENNTVNLGDEEDHFASAEEIYRNYDRAQQIYMEYDNCEINTSYEDMIYLLKKLEKSIIMHGIFSPNEDFKEIPNENVKYLLIPYLLSDVFSRIQSNKKTNLNLAKTYLDEFIKLVNHYGLVDKEQRKKWKAVFEDLNYEPTRDEKIQSHKDKKALEIKIKNLETVRDEGTHREIWELMIQSKILKAIEDIRMLNMELQMQEHKEKLDKEKLSADPRKPVQSEKVGPMKVWHVPKAPQQDQSYMVQQHKTACQHCDPMYNMKIREDLAQQVFQSGFSQPTMRLEEFADKEMAKMAEAEKQQKIANEMNKAQEDEDSDKDEISDKKTKKASQWDDWKDEHEKGAGNKNKGR